MENGSRNTSSVNDVNRVYATKPKAPVTVAQKRPCAIIPMPFKRLCPEERVVPVSAFNDVVDNLNRLHYLSNHQMFEYGKVCILQTAKSRSI